MASTVTLSAGSIAFVGFQSDSLDGFSFALLHDVKAGTEIYFTDNGFKTDGSGFKTDESLVRWTASQDYAAGQIINFESDGEDTDPEFAFINPVDGSVIDANSGTFGLSSSMGDSIIAFQDPTFGGANSLQTDSVIAGIHFGASSWATTYDNAGSTNDSGMPTGPFDLTPGTYSAVFGNVDNGRVSDAALATLTGNEDAETLRNFLNDPANWETSDSRFSPPAPSGPITFDYLTIGTEGDDTIDGNSGAERIRGLGGNDTITGNDGRDRLYGDEGDDLLRPGNGADIVYGGTGTDTLDYSGAAAGVSVYLDSYQAYAADGLRQLIHEVENVTGTDHNDRVHGDAQDNVIAVGDGADIVYGGGGSDTISYEGASSGIYANLAHNFVRDGTGTTDYVHEVENVVGTVHDDLLYGDDADNTFYAGDGSDHIGGRGGNDTVSYADAAASVHVELDKGFALDGAGDVDYLDSIENLVLSGFDDRAYGDNGVNTIDGGDGNDILYARDGDDTLIGGLGDDRFVGENGADTITGGGGADRYYLRGSETGGGDIITDFEHGVDNFYLLEGGFGTYVAGNTADVFSGTGSSDAIFGTHTSQGFAYDTSTGDLYFDTDGAGGAAAELIATLTNTPTFDSGDIVFYLA